MRIAIDGRVLDGHFPGIGRYVYHLVDALGKTNNVQFNVILDPSRADERFQVSHLSRHGNVELSSVPGSVFSPAAQWRIPRAIREQGADVFHATYWVTAYRPRIPTVLSLFDLIGVLDPEAVSPLRRVALRVACALPYPSPTLT